MRYIAQRHPYGCAIAALAMVCDKDYDDVLRCFIPSIHERKGLDPAHIEEYLFRHGWAWQVISRQYQYNRPNRLRPWPPAPWAPRHLVQVTVDAITRLEGHMLVMDANGDIADPNHAGARDFADPAYLDINWVMGCWRVAS